VTYGRTAIVIACALVALPAQARRDRPEGAPSPRTRSQTVRIAAAELRGRPTLAAAVTGEVHRGETVQVLRHSADQRWVEIDIGGGEMAWIEARALSLDAPAPTPIRADQRPRVTRVDPPARLQTRPDEDFHRIEGRYQEPERDERFRAEGTRGAERPRVEERPVGERPRGGEGGEGPPSVGPPHATRAQAEVVRAVEPPLPPHERNYFDLHVRLGAAIPQHRIATNGISSTVLPAYEYSTTNLAAGVQLGYSRAAGRFRAHLDARYLISTLGAVRYSDGTRLALRDQNIGAGLALGGFFPAAGGIDLRVRVGAEAWLTQITPSAPPLAISSEIVLGMAAGLELAMPALFRINGRPFGFRVQGGAIAPAKQMQTAGLGTGGSGRTFGAYAGAALQAGLSAPSRRGQVSLEARYDYAMVLSRYSGVCSANADAVGSCRDMSVSDARDGFVSHVATLGLYYQY
jgi:hypothetical protein